MNSRLFLISGSLFMLCAVALGAFGAHGLESRISEHLLQTWKTATQYQVYHALGLIGLGLWTEQKPITGWIKTAGGSLIIGIILFCGSLYALVLSGQTWLGIVTPFGGLAFLTGWCCWMIAAIKH
jgi:uncharacterized membrane protein YgdD (TMEM256/DUF423 family)